MFTETADTRDVFGNIGNDQETKVAGIITNTNTFRTLAMIMIYCFSEVYNIESEHIQSVCNYIVL